MYLREVPIQIKRLDILYLETYDLTLLVLYIAKLTLHVCLTSHVLFAFIWFDQIILSKFVIKVPTPMFVSEFVE